MLDGAIIGSTWILATDASTSLIKQMEKVGIPLNEYIQGKIYRGIVSGYNNAFYIDEIQKEELITINANNNNIIKPLVVGDNVRKWRIEYKNKYLLYIYHGIDINQFPGVIEHLQLYRQQLENRATKQNWYELQQPQMQYISSFEKPKIIYPEMAKESRFTIDNKGLFPNNKCFIIPSSELYLLGVLNSNNVWKYLKNICSQIQGNTLELRSIYMSKIPIPIASTTEKETISQLVQKCLDAKGVNCETWEKEIDERVAALYGL
ncbi:TaqI-like C-terminal specificity domain-containing protein [Anabaena sp. UHCC 0399]|uniref:TaqI-like C-terminal specificity domain-containing protein n=1 Tax=Anabaena sp. UHCC 0399 TaxID=3110238 RepID=UPI002B1EA9A1|nr:TaqI-like C-terminal specificity domain-containing protein [Anabaena sp. UHCC 0399]MEA5565784.1 TaqI-like C-terminal specificity domain-containing protein [Anabaena sp. UHCC 0399]